MNCVDFDFTHHGHRYTFLDDFLSFSDAINICQTNKLGRLVEIDSEDEWNIVKEAAQNFSLLGSYQDTLFTGKEKTQFLFNHSKLTDIRYFILN